MNVSISHGGNVSFTQAESIEDQVECYFPTISWSVVILMTLILVLSPLCTLLWVRFLEDRPLNRQCLLYKLNEDLSKVNLLFVLIWSLLALLLKMLEKSGNLIAIRELVKYIVVTEEALLYYILLYLCLIASLRMYRSRYQILDPVEEYFEENEGTLIMYIRLFITVLIISVLGIFYVNSVIPITYYQIIEKNHKWENIPRRSQLLYVIDIGLWTICAIFLITGKIFQWINDSQRHDDDRFEIGTIKRPDDTSSDGNRNGSVKANHEPSENEQVSFGKFTFDYRNAMLPNLLYLGSGLLIGLLMLLHYFGNVYIDAWMFLTGFVGMQGVVIPAVLIIWYENVRIYSWRTIKSHVDNARNWAHELFSSLSQSRNRVAPAMQLDI